MKVFDDLVRVFHLSMCTSATFNRLGVSPETKESNTHVTNAPEHTGITIIRGSAISYLHGQQISTYGGDIDRFVQLTDLQRIRRKPIQYPSRSLKLLLQFASPERLQNI